jgi:DNA-binding beta-propeller fold protein YncE
MRDARGNARLRTVAAAVLVAVAGCGKPPGQLFPPPAKPIVWPAPPERARIRYVGQLSTSADLKPGVPITQGFGEMLFGKAPAYSMLTPYAVCTDEADRLFVADSNAQVVHVFDLKGRRYFRWAPANREKRFAQPVGIAYDPAGRLFVADSVAGRIYEFDRRGRQTGVIGAGVVVRPCGLAFDARRRQLFVADAGAHRVLVFSQRGELVTRIGTRGVALGQFNYPTNVAVDARALLYVSDSLNFRIQQFSPQLQPLRQIGRKGDVPGYFAQPKGVAVDTQGHLYVVDANFEAVQIFNDQGALLMDFGQEGRQPGGFWLPAGIYIDRRNRIWVADCYNRRVQVFDFLPEGRP